MQCAARREDKTIDLERLMQCSTSSLEIESKASTGSGVGDLPTMQFFWNQVPVGLFFRNSGHLFRQP
jgi:hypothetical protein